MTIIDELHADRVEFRTQMQADFAELRRDIRDIDHRMTEGFRALDTRISHVKSELMKWSFVFWCGAVLAVAALAGVLRS